MSEDKLRVIHSFPVWLPQTQTWMYTQIKYLPDTIENHIVCERTEHLDQFNLPNIHSLQDASKGRYFLDKSMRKLRVRRHLGFLTSVARKFDAQIIHSHFGYIGWTDMRAVKQAGVKHVVTFYGFDVKMLTTQDARWQERYQTIFANTNKFLCEGPHMARCLVELGCPDEKISVHHLGISIDEIPYRPRTWQSSETLHVLIAASFREKKGIPYALEALAEIQNFVPLEITIIGDAGTDAKSQAEKQRILATLERGKLKSKTNLLGYQPYSTLLEEAYKNHIFISPSVTSSDGDTEGGAPVSLIEMMASGIPVVSTSHCDIPGVVQYGINDWLVKERDVSGLVNRLRWLIGNPDEWQGLLIYGRKHVEKEFDAAKQGIALARIYQNIVQKRIFP